MKTNLLLVATAWTVVAVLTAWAQRGIEFTPFVGGQVNSRLNLSTGPHNRIDLQNGLNYGVGAGYLIGTHAGVEFMWSHNQAGSLAQST